MSAGFQAHPRFQVVAAIDAQVGKPSSPRGSLGCNQTYEANIGVAPIAADLSNLDPNQLADLVLSRTGGSPPDVLISCAPCTGFSRANPDNHVRDDHRNSLVARTALYAAALKPSVIVMENAREMLVGRFSQHFVELREALEELGYQVHSEVHFLNRFGLPQRRERALVVAARGIPIRTLNDLWLGYRVRDEATHVRHAIGGFPRLAAGSTDPFDAMHSSPALGGVNLNRIKLIPRDGGSWADLRFVDGGMDVMTPAMCRTVASGRMGSHPDVYGRLWWDRPAVTIKRECGHIGNGRYSHPEQDRLCSVRELAVLQGFPRDYRFVGSMANMYRHIGDAVPPMIAYQIAWTVDWMLTGQRPSVEEIVMPTTSLTLSDVVETCERSLVS